MTKLNQILAVEKGVRARSEQEFTKAYHQIQKPDLLSGLTRTYRAKFEDGEVFPDEGTNVQVTADDIVESVDGALRRLYNVVATKDWANCDARADVVVDGKVLVKKAPTTFLLYMEKQLTDIATFVKKLPVLDPAKAWSKDENTGVFRTEPTETVKTQKTYRNHQLAEATKEHPAQVQVYTEDEVIGYWTKTEFSGSITATRQAELLDRVNALMVAVKFAREEANGIEIVDQSAGESILDYIFKA